MQRSVLVVHVDQEALFQLTLALTRAGLNVATASTYEQGRRVLDTEPPSLLVADVRLEAYNGLQLAIRTQVSYPGTRVIIIDRTFDPVTERSARDVGARYVADPLNNPQFLPTVRSVLGIEGGQYTVMRRWNRKRVSRPITIHGRSVVAEIVDVSYGGARLTFKNPFDLPVDFEVLLPETGTPVRMHRIWSDGENRHSFAFGASLAESQDPAWRQFVDSM